MNRLIVIILALLISFNCFPNKDKWDSDKKDWSKLMLYTYKGNHKKMIKLLSKQVDVNYTSRKGINALIIAIRRQDTIAMNILFRAEKFVKDTTENLIMLASSYKSPYVIELLFNQHYQLIDNKNGYSSLMSACSFGSMEIVQLLIERGANVNQQRNVDGMTPLMFAVYNGRVDVTKFLLSKGAIKNIKDKNGKTAIDYISDIPDWLKINEIDKQEMKYLLKND